MVAAFVEWKFEDAWIAALGTSSDLSGVAIRRGDDASVEQSYPCVVVSAVATTQTWSPAYDSAEVELSCRTHRHDDTTGSGLRDVIGAVRDIVKADNIIALLNQTENVHIYGFNPLPPSPADTVERHRTMSVNLECHGTAGDVGADNSTSSSSSST